MSNVNDARRELHAFLNDMAALKQFADAQNEDAQPFVAAYAAAREKAKLAAEAYALAVRS